MHALPPGVAWQTDLLTETVANATKVYFEADIGMFAQAWVVYSMFSTGLNLDQTPWTGQLDDSEALALADALVPLGITLEAAEVYEPWVIALMLEGRDMAGSDLAMASGVEATLQRGLARDRVAYFETATQQLRIFSSGSEEEQVDLLVAQASLVDDAPEQLDTIVDAWARGDDTLMAQVFAADLTGTPEQFLDRILYARNRNWVGSIEQLLATNEEDLIVVGAAHMLGAQGLVALLRDAGYSIKRVQ